MLKYLCYAYYFISGILHHHRVHENLNIYGMTYAYTLKKIVRVPRVALSPLVLLKMIKIQKQILKRKFYSSMSMKERKYDITINEKCKERNM
jgi:hypothetical protein